eukprot:3755049-Heterocapsa_arctica.AAC.1
MRRDARDLRGLRYQLPRLPPDKSTSCALSPPSKNTMNVIVVSIMLRSSRPTRRYPFSAPLRSAISNFRTSI